VLDRENLLAVELLTAAHGHDDRGRRLLLLAGEQLALRQHQVDARALDRPDRFDRARQLAFERAHVVDVLHEAGRAQALGAIEDLVANRAAARQPVFRHGEAHARDLVGRHEHLRAGWAEAVGHLELLETGHDLAAVLGI
jgi:hypothetical protein